MNKTVWKYDFGYDNGGTLQMLAGAEVIKSDIQKDKLCVWAIVDTDEVKKEPRHFIAVPTGGSVPDGAVFIDTIFQLGKSFVIHVFEIKNKGEDNEG